MAYSPTGKAGVIHSFAKLQGLDFMLGRVVILAPGQAATFNFADELGDRVLGYALVEGVFTLRELRVNFICFLTSPWDRRY